MPPTLPRADSCPRGEGPSGTPWGLLLRPQCPFLCCSSSHPRPETPTTPTLLSLRQAPCPGPLPGQTCYREGYPLTQAKGRSRLGWTPWDAGSRPPCPWQTSQSGHVSEKPLWGTLHTSWRRPVHQQHWRAAGSLSTLSPRWTMGLTPRARAGGRLSGRPRRSTGDWRGPRSSRTWARKPRPHPVGLAHVGNLGQVP